MRAHAGAILAWPFAIMKTSNGIDQLVGACVDDKRMLEREIAEVGARNRPMLSELAAERGRFVSELRALGGGAARHGGSPIELLRELGRRLERVATGPSNTDAVSACRRSLRRTEARYDKALELSWPDEVRTVLLSQRDRLSLSRDMLISIQY
jgi:hypothetical protein